MKRCACPLASLLLLAIVIIVLIFTIFRVKGPMITMNTIKITKLQLVNTTMARRTLRMNVTIDVITDRVVSSPDFATRFRFGAVDYEQLL
uniref:Late embryogenesis abundant protein LEA-2 subgroup domain-containing protein n=1 Tax=Glycine max TaxID=3847 RepID=A0A0R0J092_SOYBN